MSLLLDRGSSKNAAASRWEQSLLRVAFLPACVTVLVSITAVLATLLTAGSALAGVSGAIGSVWLAVHQVPVYISGTDLGALPLLPTILVFAGVARCAYRFADEDSTPNRQLQIVGAAIGGPLVVTVIALAVIEDTATVLGVSGPGPVPSMAIVAAVHGAAALLGVGLRAFRSNADRWAAPTWLLRSARGGMLAALGIFSAGAALVVVGVFLGWTEIASLIGAEPTVVGQLGLLLLSIMYLPNIMVGGSAVLAGTTAHIGDASFALFGVHPGPIPAVPVLGVLPQSDLGGLWPLALGVCAAVGCWLGWRYRDAVHTPVDRLRFFVAAGAVAATTVLLLGFLASGQMGSYGYIGVDAPMFALYVFGWVTAVGLLAGFGAAAVASRRRVAPDSQVLRPSADRSHTQDPYAGEEYAENEYAENEYAENEYTGDEYMADSSVCDSSADDLRTEHPHAEDCAAVANSADNPAAVASRAGDSADQAEVEPAAETDRKTES